MCPFAFAAAFASVLLLSVSARGAEQFTSEQLDFFESRVRPLLADHCQSCHGVETQESDLRLDTREGALAGGFLGAAVVPGEPDESLLIEAVRYDGLEMPPDGPLAEEQVAVLEKWVALGAPSVRRSSTSTSSSSSTRLKPI